MLIKTLVAYALAVFFALAACSKFGPAADAVFLPHSFMVEVYSQAASKFSNLIGQVLDPSIMRYAVGGLEVLCALLLVNESTSSKSTGAFLGLIIMAFACSCHFVLGDDLPAYSVPAVAGISCLFVLSEDKVKQS